MNKSIDRATGDYLVFMNAGDTFPTADTLEYVEGCVGEGEVLPGVLYGDTDIVDEMGHFLRHRRLAPPKKLTWRSFIWGMLVCHQSFYARTDIAREIHYDLHYRYSADVTGASASCGSHLAASCRCATSMPSSPIFWMVA